MLAAVTMKKLPLFITAFAGLLLAAAPAHAADMWRQPPPSAARFDWTGFYAGINGGYGWGRSSWSDPVFGFSSGGFDASGGLLGGQIGYNWQTGPWVLGIETDADWTNIKGSTTGLGGACLAYAGGQCTTTQDWFGTTRARVGYVFDNWLPYVTGGVAYGDIGITQLGASATDTRAGWAVGAGAEYSFNRNWSAKLEYLHLDLGTATFFGAAANSPTLKAPLTDDIVRAGINYHW
jgi:outer membrane immunogenic protein